MNKLFHVILWIVFILAIAYTADVIYAYPHDHQAYLDKAAIAKIQAQRLTMNDVHGENLPPPPDPSVVDATVAGIDANDNGIRDDVELAIFSEYPTTSATSTVIRAAELQYAMDVQTLLTKVTDTDVWIAAIQQRERGYGCLYDASRDPDALETEVEALILNTPARTQRFDTVEEYAVSYKLLSGPECDLSQSGL